MTATLSTVWGLGLMEHTGIAIDSWNMAVPILFIAIAAAHSPQRFASLGLFGVPSIRNFGLSRAYGIAAP